MKLYHGSFQKVECPRIDMSRKKLDFGQGFYLAKDYEQAKKWAKRFRYNKMSCVVNTYEINLEEIKEKYRVKIFDNYDKEWLHFIVEHRKGKIDQKYDVVIGGIANDKVFDTIELYLNGLLDEESTLGRLKYEQPNWQMCIRSQEIIDKYLKYRNCEDVSNGSK